MYAHICTRTGSRCTHCVEAAPSRFEPGNRLPCDVTLLFLLIPALGSPLSSTVQVCGDRIAEWTSGGEQSN